VPFPINCYFSRAYTENKSLGDIPVFVELLVRLFICTTLNIHNCMSANEPVPISDYYATYYTHSEQNGNAFVPFTTRLFLWIGISRLIAHTMETYPTYSVRPLNPFCKHQLCNVGTYY